VSGSQGRMAETAAPARLRMGGRTLPTGFACAGCDYVAPPHALPLRCPNARAGDDVDHVLRRTLDTTRVTWPNRGEANPFVRYRALLAGYHLARAAGKSDAAIVAEIERLDDAVAAVDGHGFRVTPLTEAEGLLIKDETGNVSGSHKARHLFGTLLSLRLAGLEEPDRPLAIASCGNAALAAAVVARAAGRELRVFVPVEAEASVVERITALGAQVTVCERHEGEAGDPTVLRMREAVANGALPFTCQGNENGLAIESGLTLGYELADQLREMGRTVAHLFVQVGGGALASSVSQALEEARSLGAIESLPRLYAVQTRNAHPLARAYELIVGQLNQGDSVDEALDWAGRHRSEFMWPWSPPPHSIAGGILDDETYDWLAVVRGMVATRGRPVLVSEGELRTANELARESSGIDVDHTGSAGLAGLLQLRRDGAISPNQTSVVLFTGVRRNGGTP
jgi:threonine synthase